MSVVEFLTSGGMASTGGDLDAPDAQQMNLAVKAFGSAVRDGARSLGVPASDLLVVRANFLFAAKDAVSRHFVFAEKPGSNQISYRDLTKHGRVPLSAIVQQVRQEIGEVLWSMSLPLAPVTPDQIKDSADKYLQLVMESTRTGGPRRPTDDEAMAVPELAPFIAKFRLDNPRAKKTAFIMMSFAGTPAHAAVTAAVADVLKDHGITALRADSKEYADDLFANIRTYMHCCDFGVAIFERILQDDFNPNVSLETGYMLGLGKQVCLLKDGTLKSLPSDLIGKLYKRYDPQRIAETLRPELTKWLTDRGLA